jgi:hypothetical protein
VQISSSGKRKECVFRGRRGTRRCTEEWKERYSGQKKDKKKIESYSRKKHKMACRG